MRSEFIWLGEGSHGGLFEYINEPSDSIKATVSLSGTVIHGVKFTQLRSNYLCLYKQKPKIQHHE